MNNYSFTNANRNQSALECELTHILCMSGEYDTLDTLNFAEWAKVEEPNYESVSVNGTRHPSTRAERRKKTAHAKTRHTETLHTRELRKYPYSQMLGKGKRHDKVWINEPAWVEVRTLSRMDGRERDFILF